MQNIFSKTPIWMSISIALIVALWMDKRPIVTIIGADR
jgi:hypothetical protein